MATYRDELINKFYRSFQKLDYNGMNSCYSDDIVFFDPAFGLLKGNEVRAMWEMLCTNAKDFSLTYGNIQQTIAAAFNNIPCGFIQYHINLTGRVSL